MKQKAELEGRLKEAQELTGSLKIKTEEGRALLALITRTIETMLYGEAKTPLAGGHHG